MRYFFAVLILIGASDFAYTQEKEGAFNPVMSFFQMIASLALVIGLIYVFYYISNRFLKKRGSSKGRSRLINIEETCYIAPKKSLLLVEVGGEYLLLSSSGEGIHFIKQIMIPESEQDQAGLPVKEVGRGVFSLQKTD